MEIQQISLDDAQALYELGMPLLYKHAFENGWGKWSATSSPRVDYEWVEAQNRTGTAEHDHFEWAVYVE